MQRNIRTASVVLFATFGLATTLRPEAHAKPIPAPKSSQKEAKRPVYSKLDYPRAPKNATADTYHGVTVADPYRPLEDADADATKAWVDAENTITESYLSAIPERTKIKAQLTELVNYERFGLPEKEGGRYFYSRNSGLQNQSVLYVGDSLTAQPRVLLDPNVLSDDGTVALSGSSVSEDGKYLAYGMSSAGSDWSEWKVRDIATGKDLPDTLKWIKFSGATWAKDGSGFYYSRYAEPKPGQALQEANYFPKVYFHKIGDAQAKDALFYERPDQKEWGFGTTLSEDGKFLILYVTQGTDEKNRLFYKRLDTPDAPVVELFNTLDASYSFIGNDGDTFYIATNKDAPTGKLVAVNLSKPESSDWKTLIPTSAKDNLQSVRLFGDMFAVTYLHDAYTQVRTFDLSGKPKGEIALPGIGSAGGFDGKRTDTETFYGYSGFTSPYTTYRYDLRTGKSEVFKKPKVAFEPEKFETKQVFYSSKDGTKIPLFLTYKKGTKRNGENPTILYGYGGFNAKMTPFFSTNVVTWMEMGGVYAVACLRGGGEYGEGWHQAGMKLKKQNVFDDFIAAGEYLVKEKYTSTPKLAISGGSNGGLLVGAVMNQRPDLFGACLPAVGVMDMLRFPKFTIGWAWTSDYGSPENEAEFQALRAYSPYHNLKPGTRYPATLVTTSDHDDRVVPAHSFKYVARLQEVQAPDAPPVLIRIETKAGHGAGKPISKQIDQTADVYAFLVRSLGMALPDGF
ncbi:MAG: S9 family peptidase [Akkermansiaceae bacterium]|nr:S9 family peptidase [Armatimonadota bacterium]